MPRGESTRLARRLARETGQTFVFVLTMLFALLLVVATSINIGQAVNRRILLQVLADAGAFTGATEMARGMNTIAEQNGRIQRAWASLADATHSFTVPSCVPNDDATNAYGAARHNLGRAIEAINAGYGRRAVEQAERVTQFNAVDLFPREDLRMSEGSAELAEQRAPGRVVTLEQVPDGTVSDLSGPYPGYSYRVWACRSGKVVLPREASFDLWYRAPRDTMPVAFVWVVTAPARRARWFDRFFGPYVIPEMSAAAVAKPVAGEIRQARARYVAKMVPVRAFLQQTYDDVRERVRHIYH